MSEWFRRETWTGSDRQEFNARLARSRGAANKSQYLRIQALHLASVGLHREALELLDRLIAEFPERLQLAQAHLQRADSLKRLGRQDDAIRAYRESVQAERDVPNIRTYGWLDFGWFVVEHELRTHYNEIAGIFEEFRETIGTMVPVVEYRYHAVQALLAEARGETAAARQLARRALESARQRHSGFRYHGALGLAPLSDEVRPRLHDLIDD